jgi:hypothetical protein
MTDMQLGAVNDAGSAPTVLTSTSPTQTLRIANTAGGQGLLAHSNNVGVTGRGDGRNAGVFGVNHGTGNGVAGSANSRLGSGVYGENNSQRGFGIHGRCDVPPGLLPPLGAAVFGNNLLGGNAGVFNGTIRVNGQAITSGSGFAIDHPGDPANKCIYHCSVESNDMMNVYKRQHRYGRRRQRHGGIAGLL